ncbi:cupin domain-containing protein [Cytobacillus pseudoceanisediminis]|uniref:cupin domain-containing protein n=1 Tax=Cytobacillus pseudoceanisediminis TaxID=3051614 RepID=UPI003C30AB64
MMENERHTLIPVDQMKWEPGIYENTEQAYLWEDEITGQVCFLVKLHPGSYIPFHKHPRREIAYMVDGEMILNETDVMKKGDFLTAGPNEGHDVRTETGAMLLIYIDYNVEYQKIVRIKQ